MNADLFLTFSRCGSILAAMRRSIQILLVFFLLLLASAVSAQTPLACGIDSIEGPTEVDAGQQLKFKVKISGISHTRPEFKWFMSAGTIVMGQGTDEITVDTAGLGSLVLTATVALSGVPLGCKGEASITTSVKPFICGL